MHTLKRHLTTLLAATWLSSSALAQTALPLTEGEVRRVDEHAFINIIKTDVFAGRFHHRPTD